MRSVIEVKVDIGGKTYIITSDDDYLKYMRKKFDPEMVKLFKALANDREVILDIGANIGCTAILFAELA